MNENDLISFETEEDNLNLKSIVLKYLVFWPWFLVSVFVFLFGAYQYLRYTAKKYQTTAVIKILDEESNVELPGAMQFFNVNSTVNLENEMALLKSYRLLREVVLDLGLQFESYSIGRVIAQEKAVTPYIIYNMISPDSILGGVYDLKITKKGFEVSVEDKGYELKTDGYYTDDRESNLPFGLKLDPAINVANFIGNQYQIKVSALKNRVNALRGMLEVSMIGKESDLLLISRIGESTLKSEMIINKLIEKYNLDGITDRQLVSKRTMDFVDERFVYLTEELDAIELSKQEFKKSNALSYIEFDAQNTISEKKRIDSELFQNEKQLMLCEMLDDELNKNISGLLPINIGIEDVNINQYLTEYNDKVIERDKYKRGAGVKNPYLKTINQEISSLVGNIKNSILAYKKQLKHSITKIKKEQVKYKNDFSSLPKKQKILRSITRQQEIKEALFLGLLQKREEAAIDIAVTAPSIKVIDYAVSDSFPKSPIPDIVYLVSVVLGLLFPYTVFYLIFKMDTKIHRREEMLKYFPKMPLLTDIPYLEKLNTTVKGTDDRSFLAESYRILRTNLDFLLPKKQEKGITILVTSSVKGEGKTFVSMNLANIMKTSDTKVLLLGADLRNPQIHRMLKVPKETEGLTNYIHDTSIDWRDCILSPDEYENSTCDVMVSGAIPPNPGELLASSRMHQLIEEVKDYYDYIVIDSAPALLVSDTFMISQILDLTIYIVRAHSTEKRVVPFINDLYTQKKLPKICMVLNGIGYSSSIGYRYGYKYMYNYNYNYGYGYGYSADDNT